MRNINFSRDFYNGRGLALGAQILAAHRTCGIWILRCLRCLGRLVWAVWAWKITWPALWPALGFDNRRVVQRLGAGLAACCNQALAPAFIFARIQPASSVAPVGSGMAAGGSVLALWWCQGDLEACCLAVVFFRAASFQKVLDNSIEFHYTPAIGGIQLKSLEPPRENPQIRQRSRLHLLL